MTKQSERRDAALRAQPEGYVDPARRRKPSRDVRTASRITRAARRARLAPLVQPPESRGEGEKGLTVVPRHERLGIMFLALQHGVTAVSEQFNIPESTLYMWFREEGGIQEVREYVASRASVAFQRVIQAACDELSARMHDAPNDELFASFRKMIEVGDTVRPRGRKGGGESERSPEGTPSPITLQFIGSPALPEGSPRSESQGNAKPGHSVSENAPPEDVVDGEVTDVFDDS